MSRKEETLTYKQNMSKTEVFHVIQSNWMPSDCIRTWNIYHF